MKLRYLCTYLIGFALFINFSVSANSFYALVAGGYVENEVAARNIDASSFKVAGAYQFHPSWYVEAGFQSLGEKNADLSELGAGRAQFKASGIYLAALGKASGQQGELFYRVGIMQAQIEQTSIFTASCFESNGDVIAAPSGSTFCQTDDDALAGILGLGFDYYLSSSFMLRAEVEHLQGEDDFSANAIYLGLRINF